MTNKELSKFFTALEFAAMKHAFQARKNAEKTPYVNHVIKVASLLANEGGISDSQILQAAVLHDTIEDTETMKGELTKQFGKAVTGIVLELTDDKSLPKEKRKELQVEHAPHLSRKAKLIKLCDKISNVSDVANNPPHDWGDKRRLEYLEWGEKVVAGLRGVSPKLEKLFDKTLKTGKKKIKSGR